MEKYALLGVVEPHGLLLHGIPGVGKSTLARSFLNATGRKVIKKVGLERYGKIRKIDSVV